MEEILYMVDLIKKYCPFIAGLELMRRNDGQRDGGTNTTIRDRTVHSDIYHQHQKPRSLLRETNLN